VRPGGEGVLGRIAGAKVGVSNNHGMTLVFEVASPSLKKFDIWIVRSPEEDSDEDGEYVSPGVSGIGL